MPKRADTLNRDIPKILNAMSDDLRRAADKTGEEAVAALHRSSRTLGRAARQLNAELRHAGHNAIEGVKAHPVATAAVIAAAAALLGLALSRRGGDMDI